MWTPARTRGNKVVKYTPKVQMSWELLERILGQILNGFTSLPAHLTSFLNLGWWKGTIKQTKEKQNGMAELAPDLRVSVEDEQGHSHLLSALSSDGCVWLGGRPQSWIFRLGLNYKPHSHHWADPATVFPGQEEKLSHILHISRTQGSPELGFWNVKIINAKNSKIRKIFKKYHVPVTVSFRGSQ